MRFQFLELYIQFARVLAGIIAVVAVVMSLLAWNATGFLSCLITLLMGALWSFLILVGADVLACFKAIEENTRKPTA